MAKGRMLLSSISTDARVNQLSDDTARLLFSWIIPRLDYNGVFHGNPQLVMSLVFPWRADLDATEVQAMIDEMVDAGLFVRWEEDGQDWLWLPSFREDQLGLRVWREAPSTFPTPPPDALPAELRVRLEDMRHPGQTKPEPEKQAPEPKKPPARRKKRAAPTDNARPPAVDVYKAVYHRYPVKRQWPYLDQIVGQDDDDLKRWGDVLKRWDLLGWSPMNLLGQLQHYLEKRLPGDDRKGGKRPAATKDGSSGFAALAELAEQEGWTINDGVERF